METQLWSPRPSPRRATLGFLCPIVSRTVMGAALAALLAAPRPAAPKPAPKPPSRPAPRLTLLTPPRGPSGSKVTLIGKNLGAARGAILFHGAATVVSWSDTAVTIVLKAPTAARRPVRVRRTDGRESNALIFALR